MNQAIPFERDIEFIKRLSDLITNFLPKLLSMIKGGVQRGQSLEEVRNDEHVGSKELQETITAIRNAPDIVEMIKRELPALSIQVEDEELSKELEKMNDELNKLEDYFKNFDQLIRNEESLETQAFADLQEIGKIITRIRKGESKTVSALVKKLTEDANNEYRGVRFLRSRTNWASRELTKLEELIPKVETHLVNSGVAKQLEIDGQRLLTAFNDWIGWIKAIEQDVNLERNDETALKTSIENFTKNADKNANQPETVGKILEENKALISCLENMFKHAQNADSTARAFIQEIINLKKLLASLLSQNQNA